MAGGGRVDRPAPGGQDDVGACPCRNQAIGWEGFVIENLIAASPSGTQFFFYRTAAGAEIDLLIELPGGELWAVEIKRGLAPRLEKGFYQARGDLNPSHCFVVYSGHDRYPIAEGIEVISLHALAQMLMDMGMSMGSATNLPDSGFS